MDTEDQVVEKLKGRNCLIKFMDGEELYVYIDQLEDEEDAIEMLQDIERFLNDTNIDYHSPLPGIAVNRQSVKYVRKI